jgi:hypothetical protein
MPESFIRSRTALDFSGGARSFDQINNGDLPIGID